MNDYDQEAIKDFLACNQDAKTRETGAIKYSLLMLILKKHRKITEIDHRVHQSKFWAILSFCNLEYDM